MILVRSSTSAFDASGNTPFRVALGVVFAWARERELRPMPTLIGTHNENEFYRIKAKNRGISP